MSDIIEKYKDSGFKMTPQRLAVLECLDGNKSHPSAEEIFRSIRGRFPTMSFATVYNTLEMLVRKGEVLELSIDPSKKRFDPDTAPHHHLICMKCKSVEDVFGDFGVRLPRRSEGDFEITGHHIEFYGVCPSCRGK